MRTHTEVDEPHKKKRKAETHSLTTRPVAGMTSATTREPHGMMGHAHACRRNMKPSRPAESRWCGGANGRDPWITASSFIALEGSKRCRRYGFFLSSSEKKESTDSLMGGPKQGGGVLANKIQLLYYKPRSEGSRKPGARTTLREKMLRYGAFSSLDSCGKLVGAGHKALSRLSHEKKHLRSKTSREKKNTSQKRKKSFRFIFTTSSLQITFI